MNRGRPQGAAGFSNREARQLNLAGFFGFGNVLAGSRFLPVPASGHAV